MESLSEILTCEDMTSCTDLACCHVIDHFLIRAAAIASATS